MIRLVSFFLVPLFVVSSVVFFYLSPISPFRVKGASNAYYVSSSGSDTNSGLESSPWKTIKKATSVVSSTDTVTVNAGTYNENATINSGTFVANGVVTVRGLILQGNGVVVKGFTITPTDCSAGGAIVVNGDNCRVENNIVKNSSRQGILVNGTADSTAIIGNTVTYTYNNALAIRGTNQLVENNDISHVVDRSILGCSGDNDANAVDFTGSGHVFRKNNIHDMVKTDQTGSPHMDAFQTWGSSWDPAGKNIVIEQNKIFMGNTSTGVLNEANSSFASSGFMIEGKANDPTNKAENITIKNNIISAHTGLNIGGGGNVTNLKIYNNNWKGNLSTNADPAGINLWHGVTGYEIYNNIIENVARDHIVLTGATGGTASNNLISTGLVQSTTVNTGKTVESVTYDFNGVIRPQGGAYDVGAVENGGSSTLNMGTTSMYSTFDSGYSKYIISVKRTLPKAATIQSISLYVKKSAGAKAYFGVYKDNNGKPASLAAKTAEVILKDGWNKVNVITPTLLQAGVYYLSFHTNSNYMIIPRTTSTSVSFPYVYPNAYGPLPPTYPTSYNTTFKADISMYATLSSN